MDTNTRRGVIIEKILQRSSAVHHQLLPTGQHFHVEPYWRERDVTLIFNLFFDSGQSSSLKTGLRAVTEKTEAVLFLLGDQPLVTAEIINLILAAYAASSRPIVIPVFAGRRGNPVLFSRETFPRIQSLSGVSNPYLSASKSPL